MTPLPKISVVMPVLNRANTIEKALVSVLAQNYPHVELIIIDGGSTDGTVAKIEKYADHIAYWHSRPDGSPAIAANLGISRATGDLVVLFMADDWYEPEIFAHIAKAYQQYPQADMYTCAGRIVYYDELQKKYCTKFTYNNQNRMALTLTNVCFDITSAICCRFIRKSLYERIGLFPVYDRAGKHMFSNDKEFLMRAIFSGAKDIFVPYLGHNYLAHLQSSTFGGNYQNILKLCYEHMEIAQQFLAGKTLSKKQRLLMHYWYTDNLTRLVLYKLLEKKFYKASKLLLRGFTQYIIFWPFAFIYTTIKILLKRTQRALGVK